MKNDFRGSVPNPAWFTPLLLTISVDAISLQPLTLSLYIATLSPHPLILSPHITACRYTIAVSPNPITFCCIMSHSIALCHILLYYVTLYHIVSYSIAFCCILSYPITFYHNSVIALLYLSQLYCTLFSPISLCI